MIGSVVDDWFRITTLTKRDAEARAEASDFDDMPVPQTATTTFVFNVHDD